MFQPKVFLHGLIVLMCAALGAVQAPAQNEEDSRGRPSQPLPEISYDEVIAEYGDLTFDMAYFRQYNSNRMRELAQANQEDRLNEALDEMVRRMVFEHKMIDELLKSGFKDELEYRAYNRMLEVSNLFRHYYRNNFQREYTPDEAAIKQRYEENKEDYFVEPRFQFKHIFFQTVDKPPEVQKEAWERAQKAKALIESGSSFATVADQMSDSETGGKTVGPFKPREYDEENAINPKLEETLLSMEPGEVSDILQTKWGYQILKLESYEPEHYRPLSQARAQISRALQEEAQEKWVEQLMNQYWDEAVTAYNPDVLFDENAGEEAVIAKVYGNPYTKGEYLTVFSRILDRHKDKPEKEMRQAVLDHLKNSVILRIIGAHKARELGYEKIPEYQYTVKASRNRILSNIAWERKQEKFMDENPVTEEEMREYYEQNQNAFLKPQKYRAGIITIPFPEHDEDVKYEVFKAQQEAENQALKVIERLKAGEDFAELAKELSSDPYAKAGGMMGVVQRRAEERALRDAARKVSSLKEGEFTENPVKTTDGYVIYKLYEKMEREYQPFESEAAQERARQVVRHRKMNEFQKQLMTEMVDEEKLVIHDPLYKIATSRMTPVPDTVPKE